MKVQKKKTTNWSFPYVLSMASELVHRGATLIDIQHVFIKYLLGLGVMQADPFPQELTMGAGLYTVYGPVY